MNIIARFALKRAIFYYARQYFDYLRFYFTIVLSKNQQKEEFNLFYRILAEAVGVVALVTGVISYQMNTHKKIAALKAACEGFFAVHFFMLAAYPGSAMNLIGAIRDVVFLFCVEKHKPVIPFVAVFSIAMTVCCALTWQGAISILAVGGKLCTTVAFAVKNPKFVRLLTAPSCVMWIIYDCVIFSVPGILIESFGLVSIIIGYFRYDFKKDRSAKSAAADKLKADTTDDI